VGKGVNVTIPVLKASQKLKSFAQSWWALGILAVSIGVVLYQDWRTAHPSRVATTKVGDHIPAVTLDTTDRRQVQVTWNADGKPTVIYLFAPGCEWCTQNLGAMRTVAANAHEYHFIAVSTTAIGVADYVKANGLTMPVYVAGKKALDQLRAYGTPSTLVIGPDGVVRKTWRGAYLGETADEVAQTFHVKLPILSSAIPVEVGSAADSGHGAP